MKDEELLELIKQNDEYALDKLIENYKPCIKGKLIKYKRDSSLIGLDVKDLYQEGLIGIFEAIRTYDQQKDASFKTYANILIDRKMLDLIKANKRLKHQTLNNAISLESMLDDDGDRNLYDKIEIDDTNQLNKLISEEDRTLLKNSLTEFELKVFELKYEGKSNKEISIILEKNIKSIENTLQRIKLKFKEIVNED